MRGQIFSIAAVAVITSAPVAQAEIDGHGPDSWRVIGVAANDRLNVRMGPGTDYPVIEKFAPDKRGLEQITCVPFYTMRHYSGMTKAQLAALPPRWCLMRDADMQRVGWVAQRFIAPDDGASRLPEASGSAGEGDPLERLLIRFMEGYDEQDSLQVLDQIHAILEPNGAQSSVFQPSAEIRPLTMAVLALESAEGARDRVRYRITYGIEQISNPPKHSALPLSFIQVDRFSLGSAIRQEAIASYGAENVSAPDAFDVGPHVSWRLITRPVQGMMSDIVAAGRSELSNTQAQDMICLNSPCLSPVMALDSTAPWGKEEKTRLDAGPVPFQVVRSGLLTPAAAIDTLTRASDFGEAGQSSEAPEVPDPFLEAVIEINLAQDSLLDAGMRQGGLMDDSVAAIWRRLVIIPMGENAQTPTAYQAEAYECQRGPQFPPAGGLCP